MAKKPTKRRPGRPSSGRSEYLEVRLTPEEKERYFDAAQSCGLALSDWVRLSLSAMSAPTAPKPFGTITGKNE